MQGAGAIWIVEGILTLTICVIIGCTRAAVGAENGPGADFLAGLAVFSGGARLLVGAAIATMNEK